MSKKLAGAVILWWVGVLAWIGTGVWTFCGHANDQASVGFMVGTASAIFVPWIIAGILLRWDR